MNHNRNFTDWRIWTWKLSKSKKSSCSALAPSVGWPVSPQETGSMEYPSLSKLTLLISSSIPQSSFPVTNSCLPLCSCAAWKTPAPFFTFLQVPIPLKPRESYEMKHIRKALYTFSSDFFFFAWGRKDQASKSPLLNSKCCPVLEETDPFCARETRGCSSERCELKHGRKSVKCYGGLGKTEFWILTAGSKFWNLFFL